MEVKIRNASIVALILAAALLGAFWAMTYERFPGSIFERRFLPPLPQNWIRGDYEFFYIIRTVVSSINTAILMILLATYISIFRKTESEFTFGLIIFSTVLLLYTLVSNPMVQFTFGFRAMGLGPFAMLPDLFATIALSVLLYLSLK